VPGRTAHTLNPSECGWAGLTRRVQIILSQRKRAHALCHTGGSTTIILRLLIAVQQVGRRRRKELHAASGRGAVAAWLRLMLRLLAEGGGGTAERRDGFVRRLGHASPQDCTMVRNAELSSESFGELHLRYDSVGK